MTNEEKNQVAERFANLETTTSIAKTFGITQTRIMQILKTKVSDKFIKITNKKRKIFNDYKRKQNYIAKYHEDEKYRKECIKKSLARYYKNKTENK